MNDIFNLSEIGGHVEIEAGRQLGHFRLGAAHFQFGIVLGNFLFHIAKLVHGVLDFCNIIVVGILMHFELAFVFRQLLLRFGQLDANLAAVLAIIGLQVAFNLRFQHRNLLLIVGHLPADALDQRTILLQAFAAGFELLDRRVVLILHLRNRICSPKEIGKLVNLPPQRSPHLVENH